MIAYINTFVNNILSNIVSLKASITLILTWRTGIVQTTITVSRNSCPDVGVRYSIWLYGVYL